FLYFFVRGLMNSKVDVAIANAHHIVNFERAIGIFREPRIQEWVTKHEWLVTLFNSVYIYGHWPVLIGTLVWLLWRHRDYFPVFRSALLISGAMGLVVFVTFPMAPPRFLPSLGFVDTVTLHTDAYRVLQPPAFTNQYASMPSLHVGWNLLMGVAIVMLSRNRFAKVFGVLMPLTMYTATILTANHYFVDGIAGSIFAMVGLAIAWRISGPRAAGNAVPEAPATPVAEETIPNMEFVPLDGPAPQHVAA
ncbi:MAG TPA: phosphatase PAP2 family protein, partial [Thermomicrobiales bacterium]|nr:phosphatase PAP2 family protein [Thermomicrobiales bacterium]